MAETLAFLLKHRNIFELPYNYTSVFIIYLKQKNNNDADHFDLILRRKFTGCSVDTFRVRLTSITPEKAKWRPSTKEEISRIDRVSSVSIQRRIETKSSRYVLDCNDPIS